MNNFHFILLFLLHDYQLFFRIQLISFPHFSSFIEVYFISKQKEMIAYPDNFHEVLNDIDRTQVSAALQSD